MRKDRTQPGELTVNERLVAQGTAGEKLGTHHVPSDVVCTVGAFKSSELFANTFGRNRDLDHSA